MGWSFAIDRKHGKKEEVARLTKWQSSSDAVWPLIKHSVVGNHLWMVVRSRESGNCEIALYLLQSGWPHEGWGHKSVSHHHAFDCPLSLLRMLSPSEDQEELTWRAGVHAFYATQAEKRRKSASIRVGDMFQWKEGRLVVEKEASCGRYVQVSYQIERAGTWWHCETYRAKRSMLATLQVLCDQQQQGNHSMKGETASHEKEDLQQQCLFA